MFEFQRDATELLGAEITAVLRRGAAQRPRQPRPGHRHSPVNGDTRPDRHALLELEALLTRSAPCATRATPTGSPPTTGTGGSCTGYGSPPGTRRWPTPLATGQPVRADRTWANLYDLRNHLAHSRLPDIDESLVRRFTWTRLDALQATTPAPPPHTP